MLYRINTNHLEHKAVGSQRKNHRYVARIKKGDGYRYFYTQSEYQAYMKGDSNQSSAPTFEPMKPATTTNGATSKNTTKPVRPSIAEQNKKQVTSLNDTVSRGFKAVKKFFDDYKEMDRKLTDYNNEQIRKQQEKRTEKAKDKADLAEKKAIEKEDKLSYRDTEWTRSRARKARTKANKAKEKYDKENYKLSRDKYNEKYKVHDRTWFFS